jgi:thioredoxin-related protein
MFKSVYFFGFLSLLSISNFSQSRSIAFEHATFKEIKEKALKENKLIFIDAFTTWCGPCKQMARDIFTNDTVADYYNKNFVNAKIDMEKGEGIELAKQYDVRCYPNLLFVDGNGNLVHRIAGSMSVKEFIALGDEAKNPANNFSYYEKNYENNKSNSSFLRKYIQARENTCLDVDNLVHDYFSLQKQSDLLNKENWEMIQLHTNSMTTNEYDYLIANKQKFDELYTAKSVNEKLDDIHKNTLFAIVKAKPLDEKYYQEVKSKILALNTEGSILVAFDADLRLARKKEDWNTFAKLAVENIDTYYKDDVGMLNSIAWDFYEKVENKNALLKAEDWAKKASDTEKNYAFLDTYASVLYKLGKKQLALDAANKAIEEAKKEKLVAADYQGTTDLLKKIKELK